MGYVVEVVMVVTVVLVVGVFEELNVPRNKEAKSE